MTTAKLFMPPSRDGGTLEMEHLNEIFQMEMQKLYVLRMEH